MTSKRSRKFSKMGGGWEATTREPREDDGGGPTYSCLSFKQIVWNKVLGKRMPSFVNPVDRFMNMISIYPERVDESKKTIERTCDAWASSQHQSELEDVQKSLHPTACLASALNKHALTNDFVKIDNLIIHSLINSNVLLKECFVLKY